MTSNGCNLGKSAAISLPCVSRSSSATTSQNSISHTCRRTSCASSSISHEWGCAHSIYLDRMKQHKSDIHSTSLVARNSTTLGLVDCKLVALMKGWHPALDTLGLQERRFRPSGPAGPRKRGSRPSTNIFTTSVATPWHTLIDNLGSLRSRVNATGCLEKHGVIYEAGLTNLQPL